MQLKIQASWAWAATWLWTKMMLEAGSTPQAIIAAAAVRELSRSSCGSCQTVIACMSTTQ